MEFSGAGDFESKSASRCFFCKGEATSFDPGCAPVYLNVYDLTPINGYFYWAGLGIFHSGVEEYAFGAHEYPTSGVFEVEPRQCPGFKFRKSIVIGTTSLDPIKDICYKLTGKHIPKWVNRLAGIVHGVEYAFGAHEYPTSGVFEVEPRQCPGFKFRKSIVIGTTSLDPIKVRDSWSEIQQGIMEIRILDCQELQHFCKDICYKLTGNTFQNGSICNCILPETLKTSVLRHDPNYQPYDSEKRRLRCALSCLSSVSIRQKIFHYFYNHP
ncbi:J-domain protein required for chloroplast accumulation response 1, putative isoform 1 [Hibiscus syriacus]|uniref:J-domain protein required for chloroplast accumulation response 1, putative isoform 1 n=1 Tax=Hibiscus syriacus TaxID=106335 RepID=A0A6A3CK77_HIBSY|nr:J-domain protein required for chloroplast accumulation response 1, putative isoform 1 [Hibiscus syriacus]